MPACRSVEAFARLSWRLRQSHDWLDVCFDNQVGEDSVGLLYLWEMATVNVAELVNVVEPVNIAELVILHWKLRFLAHLGQSLAVRCQIRYQSSLHLQLLEALILILEALILILELLLDYASVDHAGHGVLD